MQKKWIKPDPSLNSQPKMNKGKINSEGQDHYDGESNYITS